MYILKKDIGSFIEKIMFANHQLLGYPCLHPGSNSNFIFFSVIKHKKVQRQTSIKVVILFCAQKTWMSLGLALEFKVMGQSLFILHLCLKPEDITCS